MQASRMRFYLVVTLPAAVLMALEIVSSRILAPQFGSSVYVWGSIISIFLAAMSLGYFWGGRLADRLPTLHHLGLVLLGAAGSIALVFFFGRPLTSLFGAWTDGSPWGTLLATTVVFGPPTVLLAIVSPYAVKLATRDLGLLGGTAGHLFAISTAGSLAGTLGATFFLIPWLDLEAILRLLIGLTLVAVFLASRDRRVVVLGLFFLGATFVPLNLAGTTNLRLLAERMTPYQTLKVIDDGVTRTLVSDRTPHAEIDVETGRATLAYPQHAPLAFLLNESIESVLVLGMGAGNVGTVLRAGAPDLRIDWVDIDPVVPELAREFFGFAEKAEHVFVDDARRFLNRHRGRQWDYVFLDTYIGLSLPFHLTTVEFFQEVHRHLTPQGVVGLNLATHDLQGPLSAAILRSLSKAFGRLYIFAADKQGNHVILASRDPLPRDRVTLENEAARLGAVLAFDPALPELVKGFREIGLDLDQATLLTDDFAPVHHLLSLDPAAEQALSRRSE